jgi:hypothetical protein
MVDNINYDKDKAFASTLSYSAKPRVVNSNPAVNHDVRNNDKVPPVPLNSCTAIKGKEKHWLPSFIEDQLYLQMCEKEIEYRQGQCGKKISKYYLEAAKYAGRISAGVFDVENAKYTPVFEIHYRDFTPRLQAELLLLMKESPSTLRRVMQNAVFRIFEARHKLIFYQYIENNGFNWRFVAD